MLNEIHVAVVDNQPLFREGVSQTISASDRCRLVAQGSDYDDAVRIADTFQPQVMLLDFDLPGGGIRALEEVARRAAATRTIMLTTSHSETDLSAAFQAGARGYIAKGIRATQLLNIVDLVYNGDIYTDPTFAAAVLARRFEKPAPAAAALAALTQRENEILAIVARGRTNKEIARHYRLSEKTVKHHMTSILQKLGARNRVEAALIARETAAAQPNPRW